MKRFKSILVILILLLLATGAMAFKSMRASSNQTASAAITTSGGYFHGIMFTAPSVFNATVDIYDNATTAAGRKLMPTATITTAATARERAFSFDPPVFYTNGIYVNVTTTDTLAYIVYFSTEND